jgi:hypothetical protein
VLGELDTFPFILGEKLGKTIEEIDRLSHQEYLMWRAFFVYRNALQDMREVGDSD